MDLWSLRAHTEACIVLRAKATSTHTHTHRQRHADRQTDKEGIVNMKRGKKISMNMNIHFITDC